jgi:hypothetical protein
MTQNGISKRSCLAYTLALLTIMGIPICLFLCHFTGIGDDFMRWVRSLEFPALQARYESVGNPLTTVTTDTLIKEDRSISNVVSETHSDYTGCVAGHIERVYGTNRPFESVLADYAKFFSSRSEWKARDIYFYSTSAIVVRFTTASKTLYPDAWAKYQLVYDVYLVYSEPGGCLGG